MSEARAVNGLMTSGQVAKTWARAIQSCRLADEHGYTTLAAAIGAVAEEHADRVALSDLTETLTYRQFMTRIEHYAAWARYARVAPGDVVGLLMPNCADYLAIWLGIGKAGGTVALINTNLSGDVLRHAVKAAGANRVIVSACLLSGIAAAQPDMVEPGTGWIHGGDAEGLQRVDHYGAYDGKCLTAVLPPVRRQDKALMIYTSGTTGLPKAAHITHARVLEWSFWFAGLMDAQPDDRLYDCLPLYHSTGGIVATGAMLVRGASVVIRPKFSSSEFWSDLVKADCTIFQYIGELCRYLTLAPESGSERAHRLRLCCGNGLQGEVWRAFENRFGVSSILEFYAATEGGISLYNCDMLPGAIGRVPRFLEHRFPLALVQCDTESGEVIRDSSGRCVRCDADQPGEAIGRLDPKSDEAARRFDGYSDPQASARKLLHDVFEDGDVWLRSGDLLRRDANGYYFFVDRLGDTFRWKGENVSTAEVAAVMSGYEGVTDCVVYGVSVPGAEGRAGMASIVTRAGFNLVGLKKYLVSRLPDYARPVLLRQCRTIERTGTFKLTKTVAARVGYLAADAEESLWISIRGKEDFVALQGGLLDELILGRIRL